MYYTNGNKMCEIEYDNNGKILQQKWYHENNLEKVA